MRNSKTRSVTLLRLLLMTLATLFITPKALAGLNGSQTTANDSIYYILKVYGSESAEMDIQVTLKLWSAKLHQTSGGAILTRLTRTQTCTYIIGS